MDVELYQRGDEMLMVFVHPPQALTLPATCGPLYPAGRGRIRPERLSTWVRGRLGTDGCSVLAGVDAAVVRSSVEGAPR